MQEHDVIDTEFGRGTIVHIYPNGKVFEVEVNGQLHQMKLKQTQTNMATTAKAPAKKTATKTATGKKSDADSKPANKPTPKAKDFKPLPFKAPNGETAMVTMPNGQPIKKKEAEMLHSKLILELRGFKPIGESAESTTQRLMNSRKKGNSLMNELSAFVVANVLPKKITT